MKQAYDPVGKFLFSWDGDFRFEGGKDQAPQGAWLVPENEDRRIMSEMVGCMFLSACRNDCLVVRADASVESAYLLMGRWAGRIRPGRGSALFFKDNKWDTVCLCGPIVRDPAKVAELCRVFPSMFVYVCPLVDELAVFGTLVGNGSVNGMGERPRRASMLTASVSPQDGRKSVPYNPKMEADGYGKMANIVAMGRPAFNGMMSGPGTKVFYGKALRDCKAAKGTYFVMASEMDRFFPREPLSAKLYAAETMPVRMKNSEKFGLETGCWDEEVDVMATSNSVPGTADFARFYRVMSGKSVFRVSDLEQGEKMPVFTWDRAYPTEDVG